ncbi:meiosis regulator and mRNA stability factor 1-like isoform X3 [Cyprinus carpio]|uniref:Meiosis regulator and mRNA stability factor 1 n=1 Tax=Cyprinus carpio TaxID=7962 RepID=A0A9Q9Y4T0_CYPCA|nr:meiosis regulator and mRNA stability factor 1-like isoform X3 [Cyprinus carpio]
MEVRKPVLELKDVPPPPPHSLGAASLSVSVCPRCEASIHLQQSCSEAGGGFPLCVSQTNTPAHPPSVAQSGPGGPCCAGLRQRHTCALCKPAPSGVCHCHRAQQHPFSHGDPSSPSHLCSSALHLSVGRAPPCVKGVHCLQDCWRKVGRLVFLGAHPSFLSKAQQRARQKRGKPAAGLSCGFSVKSNISLFCFQSLHVDSGKVWPNIPPPVPVCNGCGVTGASPEGLLGVHLSKTTQKYGAPETAGQEALPPIGVFWDIENCAVPSGRSAATVVQRLRERFFQGHREAEFICVCDINKENKAVIQELNNCQVTVAHINATAKNAADDKLRQSLRRFAETHAAPATVIVVSSDVNFASELSDLRHRHGFQVILVHKSQASSALLQHAHLRAAFEEFVSDLPPGMVVKSQAVSAVTRPATASPQNLTVLPAAVKPAETPQRSRRRDSPGQTFQVSTPSAFSKLSLQRNFSPMMLSQSSWSSRGSSPCLSNRSSPLSTLSPSICTDGPAEPFSDGVDVQVTNLDYRMSRKDLQQILRDVFAKHGRVKSVDLSPHTDYQLKARVHMSSLQQAIGAVSLLHRYKIGSKRIHVSLVTGASNKSLTCLSSEIISILQDAPANCLPLYKFTETYERKFGHKLVVSDLYRLPEVVCVREQGGGRLVCLLSSTQARQSPLGSAHSHNSSNTASPVLFEELEYHEPVCRRHCTQQDFSESDFDPDSYVIPFVLVSLKVLAAHVHGLLQSHEGTVPLLSFPECYAAEFSPLAVAEEGELEGSVPLEHLITCIPGVTIVTAQNGFKIIKWIHNKPPPPNADPWLQRSKSPVGNPQLIQFSREMIDLMKNQPSCLVPITKFIPAYHHHFAKQCRVSDYGYSKLLELLEAVPHVLQILGLGSKRLLTLTHRAQIKRFTQDLLKLLKFQASKQVLIGDFSQAYHWCFSRNWQVVDYGMCDLMDLLAEIPDTTITVSQQDGDTLISVPKRERTAEELERTRQFGKEVVDLLRHQPYFRMPFSKFIPTYHHHFGRQCKLSYYGFTKLMELFEAIPDILLVLECGEERLLALTEVERVKALVAQLVKLLRAQRDSALPVSQLLSEYSKTFGYSLRLQDYDAATLPALLNKLCHVVKVVDTPEGKEVQLINRKSLRALTSQLLALMMSLPEDRDHLGVEELRKQYELSYGAPLNPCEYGFISLSELLKSLPYLLQLSEGEQDDGDTEDRVRLTRLYQFARSIRALLHTYHYNQIFLSEFCGAFSKYTGRGFQPQTYGFKTLEELLAAIPQVVWIKGHGHKKIIVLKNDMRARGSPAVTADELRPDEEPRSADSPASGEMELLCLGSPVDLLCAPVPSCLPSPQLRPDPVQLQPRDLIRFEPHPHAPSEQEPVHDQQPQSANGPLMASASENGPDHGVSNTAEPLGMKTCVTDSPGRRTARNKVKLAANFSFTPALSV